MASTPPFSADRRRARLVERHRLVSSRRSDDVVAIADSLVALHSSDPVSVYLSALQRMENPSVHAVEQALYEDRSLVRLHAMRRTLWVATPEVARFAHGASTEKLVGVERRRLAKLLVDSAVTDDPDGWIDSAARQTLAALHDAGEASTRELGEAVPSLRQPLENAPGTAYATTISAHSRVLLLLGLQGTIIRTRPLGTWISGQYRWASTSDWLADPLAGIDHRIGVAEMARRWLASFGPGTEVDLRWWGGWTKGDTARALADIEAVPVDIDGARGWVLPGDGPADGPEGSTEGAVGSGVALLPGLDPTSMGWKERDWYVAPELGEAVFDRNGNCGPTIWVDGRVVGGWAQMPDGTIALGVLLDVGREALALVDAEAHRLEAALGDVRFSVRFPPNQKLPAE